jgi:hypothetical protein
MKEADPVRYLYFGSMDTKHQGVVTVAYERRNGMIFCGFAFCSPKDPFCRRIGRAIASGRLQCDRLNYATVATEDLIQDVAALFRTVHDRPRHFQGWDLRRVTLRVPVKRMPPTLTWRGKGATLA